jgi:hypothetical protein
MPGGDEIRDVQRATWAGLSVWAGPGENPWTTIAMQAIAAEAAYVAQFTRCAWAGRRP